MTHFLSFISEGEDAAIVRFDIDDADLVQEVIEEEIWAGRLHEECYDALEEYDGVSVIRI